MVNNGINVLLFQQWGNAVNVIRYRTGKFLRYSSPGYSLTPLALAYVEHIVSGWKMKSERERERDPWREKRHQKMRWGGAVRITLSSSSSSSRTSKLNENRSVGFALG